MLLLLFTLTLAGLPQRPQLGRCGAAAPAHALAAQSSCTTESAAASPSATNAATTIAATALTAASITTTESAAKKPRTTEGDAAAATAEAAPAKPAVDPNRDEVAEGAPRLAQHIMSAAKFNKVAAMAYALLTLATLPQDASSVAAVVPWAELDLVEKAARLCFGLVVLCKLALLLGMFLMHTRVRFRLQFLEFDQLEEEADRPPALSNGSPAVLGYRNGHGEAWRASPAAAAAV